MSNINIQIINQIAIKAGKTILEIYNSGDFGVEIKKDNSPLTKADKAANEIIVEGLHREYPEIPILSEEGKDIPYKERKKWDIFWLVDPLDGTKEFIKRNDEFTVNIALIQNNKPIAGVIFAPVLNTLYYAQQGHGAFKQVESKEAKQILVETNSENGMIAVQSRSHSSEKEKEFLSNYNIVDSISKGSSLKFCMVAEGKAHIYYRSGPTMEWDTGAGHAIVLEAGGKILDDTLVYNKPVLRNDGFCVVVPN